MTSDGFAERVRLLLEKSGIDVIYAVTVLGLLITASYYRDAQNWSKLEGWHKGIVLSAAFGTAVLVLICFLRLIGLIKF